MPSVNPNIALIDEQAARLGIDLKRIDANVREFIMPGGQVSDSYTTYQLSPYGDLILVKKFKGEARTADGQDSMSIETVLDTFKTLSGTRRV